MATRTITTPCGKIHGTAIKTPGITAYKGIRYATAGRWEYPVPVTKWEGTYDATAYGAACYQPRSFFDEAKNPGKAFYYNEFRRDEVYPYSEDCLFLNVFVPDDVKKGANLPVLFYIHGGGFTGGCGNEKHFDGPKWPLKGVIGVTMNYRLGPLGFATFREQQEQEGHTGNFALYDAIAALTWVHDNIAAFGGDPENISVMGQSAGGGLVQMLCTSPATGTMIKKAIMSSGAGYAKKNAFSFGNAESHYPFWDIFMEKAGTKELAALRQLPVEQVYAIFQQVIRENPKLMMASCTPVIDGIILTENANTAVENGRHKHIPYMMGSNGKDTGTPFLHKMAKDWCRMQADAGLSPSYCYFFDRNLPGDGNGSWHSSDLWYWFGTLENCWRPFTEKDYALSDAMVSALTNFCKTGSPNGDGLVPEWLPAGKGQPLVMRFDDGQPRMGGVNIAHLTHVMNTLHPVGE